MEINIDNKRNNPLLKRTEIHFTIIHKGEKTPDRELVRTELAEKLNAKKENVVVNYINPSFGLSESIGYAKVYDSKNQMEDIEREYVLKRNTPGAAKKEKPKKEEKPEEKPEETKEQEKPEEQKTEGESKPEPKIEEKEPKEKQEPEQKDEQAEKPSQEDEKDKEQENELEKNPQKEQKTDEKQEPGEDKKDEKKE